MRIKRTLSMLVSAMLTLAVCLTALPRGAQAAVSVNIGSSAPLSTSSGLVYYVNGGSTYNTEPAGGWNAFLEERNGQAVLHLKDLRVAPGNEIGISASGLSLTLDLQGTNTIDATRTNNEHSMIECQSLTITGNGSLSVRTATPDTDGVFGIKASSITLQGGATLIVAGEDGATSSKVENLNWENYTVTGDTGSCNPTNPSAVTKGNYDAAPLSYKYLKFTAKPIPDPDPVITATGSTRFLQGAATDDAVFTVNSDVPDFNATNNYDRATLDGQALALGSVGTPGADGSVANGSIVVTINQARLNKLAAGNHTLVITLRGGSFVNSPVRGVISVIGQGGGEAVGGDTGATVPQTGDNTPIALFVGVALLCGVGLAVRRRRRA